MVILMLMALMGAVLGALTKPRFVAAPIAVGLVEGMRWLVGLSAASAINNADAPVWAIWSLSIVSDPLDDYLPLLAVSAGSSLFAAAMAMVHDRHRPPAVSVAEATRNSRQVRNGRFVRVEGMVEERAVQQQAERRQRALLGL